MNTSKVLIVTQSSLQGVSIKKYIKPITAHVVAGTNLFTDFLGGLTDIFGGRSHSYQKQLRSLYSEALERIQIAAQEVGANCVVGLSIDLDEISGKGKSMFMITAIGTAVVIDIPSGISSDPPENRSVADYETIINLQTKYQLLNKAEAGTLILEDDTWDYITSNAVHEALPYVMKQFSIAVYNDQVNPEAYASFYKQMMTYLRTIPAGLLMKHLYGLIDSQENERFANRICELIKDLLLFDFEYVINMLKCSDFTAKKRALRLCLLDKPYYEQTDVHDYKSLIRLVSETFTERGLRTTKKQLLSSKEKEVWNCECGKLHQQEEYCSSCHKDIYGFTEKEPKPNEVEKYLANKAEYIQEILGGPRLT